MKSITSGEHEFVEEVGVAYNSMGLPRMRGIIVGYLLICTPPHQTARQIQEALEVSAGSVSMTLRSLVDIGSVERVAVPGDASKHYKIGDGVWPRVMFTRLQYFASLRELADRGLQVLDGAPRARTGRLREMRDFNAFMQKEIPTLFARWEQRSRRG